MTERTPLALRTRGGRYQIYWNVRVDGKWRLRTRMLRTSDLTEAERQMALLSTKLALPMNGATNATVAEAIDAYTRRYLAPRGQDAIAKSSLAAPREHLGKEGALTIDEGVVQNYVRRRQRGIGNRKPVAPPTVRKELTMLQAALNWFAKHEAKDPRRFSFEKPDEGEARDVWIDEDQEQDIRMKLAGDRLDVRLFFEMGITFAVRRGAMLDLTWRQVDWRSDVIDFNTPGARRTRKRRPISPMTDDVRAMLRAMQAEQGDPAPDDRVLDGEGTLKAFNAAMKRIGYTWVTPHVLKHSAITLMVRAGVQIEMVARVTSTRLETITRHYRHHDMNEARAALERRKPGGAQLAQVGRPTTRA